VALTKVLLPEAGQVPLAHCGVHRGSVHARSATSRTVTTHNTAPRLDPHRTQREVVGQGGKVLPIGNVDPDAGTHVAAPASSSETLGAVYVTVAPGDPGATLTLKPDGTFVRARSVSVTLT